MNMNEAKQIDDTLDAQDILFNDYFDGELSEEEQREFKARLDADENFRKEYKQFFDIMGGLRAMPFEFAPDDFENQVRSKIRSRSKGRFFADNFLLTSRVPYEVVGIVMIIVMISAYFMMGIPYNQKIQDLNIRPKLIAPKIIK